MGIRGLTTHIARKSHLIFEDAKLSRSYLIIDGNSARCQIYQLYTFSNDCFSGDYDKFRHAVYEFFETLSKCEIEPIVIYDGGYEERKIKTALQRMENRLKNCSQLNSWNQGMYTNIPLVLHEVFKSTVMELNVKCFQSEFESDGLIASLAQKLNCPVLSFDSDFYIFDALYVTFKNLRMIPRRFHESREEKYYLDCKIYKADNFLRSFGGMDKANLPLLAALLGNDYIDASQFAEFDKRLRYEGITGNNREQQRIEAIINWLKNHSFSSAYECIVEHFKQSNKKHVIKELEKAIDAYAPVSDDVLKLLDIEVFPVVQPRELDTSLSHEETVLASNCVENAESKGENPYGSLPKDFLCKFRKSIFPSDFMDIVTLNTYFCVPQVENLARPSSLNISLDILSALHKILRGPESEPLTYYTRDQSMHIKKFILPLYKSEVPDLSEIEKLNREELRSIFLKILEVDEAFIQTYMSRFPENWHLYLITLNYWLLRSKSRICKKIFIYAFCGIVILYVDKQIGFYRSFENFSSHLRKIDKASRSETECRSSTNLNELVETIDPQSATLCMKELIFYFCKLLQLFDRSLVHDLAEFQNCFHHIKFLNSIFDFPFKHCNLGYFFNGTFLYNIADMLRKRSNVDAYINSGFLPECPIVLNVCKSFAEVVYQGYEELKAKNIPKC